MIRGITFRLSESIAGAFELAIGLFIGLETYEMAGTGTRTVVGPHLFPYLVAFGLNHLLAPRFEPISSPAGPR